MTLTQRNRKADRRRNAQLRHETSRKQTVCILFALLTSSSAMDLGSDLATPILATDAREYHWTDQYGDFTQTGSGTGLDAAAEGRAAQAAQAAQVAADRAALREAAREAAEAKKQQGLDATYGTGRHIKDRFEAERQERLAGAEVPGMDETEALLMSLCEEHQIDLKKLGYNDGLPIERQLFNRFVKMVVTGAAGGGAYVGVGAATKALAMQSGACHLAAHTTTSHSAGALVANTGAGLKGSAIVGVAKLLPALAGAGAGLYTYNRIQTYYQRLDQQSLLTLLFRIRELKLTPAEQDKRVVAACIDQMRRTLNLSSAKFEFSGETSVFERAHQLDGMYNTEDKLYNKSMPVQKIGAITHGIYHSPLVPIHESLSFLISVCPSTYVKGALTTALLSPAIPLAGFPLAYAAYEAYSSMLPGIFKDAAVALNKVQNMDQMEKLECGLDETMFFKYRERVHTSFDVLEHNVFEGVFALPGMLYKALTYVGVLHQCMNMPGPSYLDERMLAGEQSVAMYNVDANFLREVANAADKDIKHVTVADLAAYRASKIEPARLQALADAIKGMAEPGHTESWTYEKLQEDMGLSFPTLVQRDEVDEELPKMLYNADEQTYFDHESQQGRIQAACFVYALATRGDIGCPLSASQFDKGYTWGAPRLTNAFLGSEVYYKNRRYRVEKKTCNGKHRKGNKDTKIKVTLKPLDVEKFVDSKPIVVEFAAEQRHEDAEAHGGAHGQKAGAVMGSAGAILAVGVGNVVSCGGALAVGGAATAGAYVGKKTGAFADDTFCVADLNKLHDFKVADVMNFHNIAAYYAWDTMFAPLSKCLNELKEEFPSFGGVAEAEVIHTALKQQIVAEQAAAEAQTSMMNAGLF